MIKNRFSIAATIVCLVPASLFAQIHLQFEVATLDTDIVGITATTLGPDGHLYVGTVAGQIYRYMLDEATGIPVGEKDLLFQADGPEFNIGVEFDPAATADNLIVWNTHSPLNAGTRFRGTLSRLELAPAGEPITLATRQNYIVGMQTDNNDHVVNQMAFGTDGRLYFPLGSNGGASNNGIIGASILVADVTDPDFLQNGQPLNANTDQGYDPFAPDAKLQLYATGVRNAFDLVWHSNGNLYTAINGNDGNRISPDDPTTPLNEAINLRGPEGAARIVEGGYYGHPSAQRGEFVGYGGNPTDGDDGEWEIGGYPVGVVPEPLWNADDNLNLLNFTTADSISPDGIDEYISGNELNGRLLIAYFSRSPRELVSVQLDDDGGFVTVERLLDEQGSAITGSSTGVRPLDLIVDDYSRVYVGGFVGNNQGTAGKLLLLTPLDPNAVRELFGDYNNNGVVEQGDLDLVLLNWGRRLPQPLASGWLNDFPLGVIDQQELDAVLLNWGSAPPTGAAAIPEPASLALLAVCAVVLNGAARLASPQEPPHARKCQLRGER